MTFRHLRFDVVPEAEGRVGMLTVNRPDALNALNRELMGELEQWVNWAAGQSQIRAIVVTGGGEKAFVAGADIKEMQDFTRDQALAMAERGQRIFTMIENLPQATIAAVNGFALGGGLELAMACDFMIASNRARFGLPEVSLGLIPGYGGTQRLARLIGKSLARMVALTGEMFSADQGREWGLFAKVVEPADLAPTAVKLAMTIASRSPRAVALAKKAIAAGYDVPQEAGMKIEAGLFAETFTTADHVEGIRAFIDKRPPRFEGR